MNVDISSPKACFDAAAGRLPRVPSELLRRALEDLDACARDSRYKIDMAQYHKSESEGACSVCLAGAVMAKSLHAHPHESFGPKHFPGDTAALLALDYFRKGDIQLGLNCLPIHCAGVSIPALIKVPRYCDDPVQWRNKMHEILGLLEWAGL